MLLASFCISVDNITECLHSEITWNKTLLGVSKQAPLSKSSPFLKAISLFSNFIIEQAHSLQKQQVCSRRWTLDHLKHSSDRQLERGMLYRLVSYVELYYVCLHDLCYLVKGPSVHWGLRKILDQGVHSSKEQHPYFYPQTRTARSSPYAMFPSASPLLFIFWTFPSRIAATNSEIKSLQLARTLCTSCSSCQKRQGVNLDLYNFLDLGIQKRDAVLQCECSGVVHQWFNDVQESYLFFHAPFRCFCECAELYSFRL